MRVSNLGKDGFVIENPDRDLMRLIGLKHRIRLEKAGLRTRGQSARAQARSMGFKGNADKQIAQLEQAIAEREKELGIKTVVRE